MTVVSQKLIYLSILFFIPVIAIQPDNLSPYGSKKPLPEPAIFGEGIISTGDGELNAVFTPDGKSLYFTKRVTEQFMTIVVSHYKSGKWTQPEVTSFSGQYSDYDPFISPDGSKIFFCSDRSVKGGGAKKNADIWVVERNGSGWSEPKHLGDPINTDSDEYYPSISSNGTLYFGSERIGSKGKMDLYRSRLVNGKYEEPENLGDAINSENWEGDPYISPDESYLIFLSSNRPEGYGGGDLYISYRKNGAWTKAVNLGPKINSSVLDYCPTVSPDGKYFFFTSKRSYFDKPLDSRLNFAEFKKRMHSPGNGRDDIYQVDISVLNLKKGN